MLCPLHAEPQSAAESHEDVLKIARQLPPVGVLKKDKSGYVYLQLSNDYINKLYPLIICEGAKLPLPTKKASVGASITVFESSEGVNPQELEEEYDFLVKSLVSATIKSSKGLKREWALIVEAPALEALREKYLPSKKSSGQEFKIPICKQLPAPSYGYEANDNLSTHNFADLITLPLQEHGDFVSVNDAALLEVAVKVNRIAQLRMKKNGFSYTRRGLPGRFWL